MEKCFMDMGEGCYALICKDCRGCSFRKTKDEVLASNHKAYRRLKSLDKSLYEYFLGKYNLVEENGRLIVSSPQVYPRRPGKIKCKIENLETGEVEYVDSLADLSKRFGKTRSWSGGKFSYKPIFEYGGYRITRLEG